MYVQINWHEFQLRLFLLLNDSCVVLRAKLKRNNKDANTEANASTWNGKVWKIKTFGWKFLMFLLYAGNNLIEILLNIFFEVFCNK